MPLPFLRPLWDLRGTTSAGQFAAWGISLTLFKYVLDQFIAKAIYGRPWHPGHYLEPVPSFPLNELSNEDQQFLLTLVVVSLPFLLIGVVLTVRRLRSAGLPLGLSALFFFPVLNILFFATLCFTPERTAQNRLPTPTSPTCTPRIRRILAIGGAVALSLAITAAAVYLFEQYAAGLFLGLPFVLSFAACTLYHIGIPSTHRSCIAIGLLANATLALALFIFAIEGIICILMAAPVAIIPALLGSSVAHFVLAARPAHRSLDSLRCVAVLPLLVPAIIALEAPMKSSPVTFKATTTDIIQATPETIFPHLVAFAEIPEPDDLLFTLGVAYPVRATVQGTGVGAVRHCVFSTGAFVEPITAWEQDRRIAFDVIAQPPPMDELSIYHHLDTPHLHDYFRSKRGELRLDPLPDGTTRITGTTWYEHDIAPSLYWRLWSDAIVHKIHARVLTHIKNLSESPPAPTPP